MTNTTDPREQACTCHPLDNPPVPCAQRYAFTECLQAHIRALEAKVWEKTADAESHLRHERMWRTRAQEAFAEIERLQKVIVDEHVADEGRVDELTADRDRLSEALAVEQRLSKSWQETAEKFRGERDRLAGEVERLNARHEHARKFDSLDVAQAEVARLTSEVASMAEKLGAALLREAQVATELAAAREALEWIADNTGRDTWLSQFERRFDRGDVNDLMAAIDAARRAGEVESR